MKKGKKIEVAVRMRPLLYQYEDAEAWCINEDNNKISSLPRCQALKNNSVILNEDSSLGMHRRKSKIQASNIYEFTCDHVFKDTESNREVYDHCCAKVVDQFLEGNHSTIFMYGQTTSGKTYTMLGNQSVEGLILYSLKHIFGKISSKTTMMISYLQIYNEQINDLLKEGSVNLKIADESVLGLSQCPISNIEQALDLLSQGEYQRAYAQKKYHDHSSRSHTIFQIKMMESETKVKAILNLVDLAGSERLTDEDSNEETGYINKSLFILSNVINKLGTSKKNSHIPFRDSKLTRLLAPSLTTSKKTLIICTISPAQINFAQTLSTLRFATQSRKVELKGLDQSFNESIEINRKKISQLQEQNSLLKRNLSSAQDNKENQFKFVDGKIKSIEEMIDRKEIKVESAYQKGEWKKKANTLCEEYERNIEILQKEYLKAIVNLTANQFSLKRQNVKVLLDKASISSNPITIDLNDY